MYVLMPARHSSAGQVATVRPHHERAHPHVMTAWAPIADCPARTEPSVGAGEPTDCHRLPVPTRGTGEPTISEPTRRAWNLCAVVAPRIGPSNPLSPAGAATARLTCPLRSARRS